MGYQPLFSVLDAWSGHHPRTVGEHAYLRSRFKGPTEDPEDESKAFDDDSARSVDSERRYSRFRHLLASR